MAGSNWDIKEFAARFGRLTVTPHAVPQLAWIMVRVSPQRSIFPSSAWFDPPASTRKGKAGLGTTRWILWPRRNTRSRHVQKTALYLASLREFA